MDDLLKKKENILKAIHDLEDILFDSPENYDLLYEKHQYLYEELYLVSQEIKRKIPPICSDGCIDLKKNSDNVSGCYDIYLHDTNECIGEIEYRSYHCNEFLGDVGFSIFPEYQGNHYAFMALNLLSDYLFQKGIPDFWISAYIENLPSMKTILKYGGVLKNKDKNFMLFECETRPSLDEKITHTSGSR